jgi:hypothetical protein
VRPRLIALDSSHLAAVAADAGAIDHARKKRARVFEKAIFDSGSVIVLSFHHIEELLSHHRDEVVGQRIGYLQSLPVVAAVASFRKDGVMEQSLTFSLSRFRLHLTSRWPKCLWCVTRSCGFAVAPICWGRCCRICLSCASILSVVNDEMERLLEYHALILREASILCLLRPLFDRPEAAGGRSKNARLNQADRRLTLS